MEKPINIKGLHRVVTKTMQAFATTVAAEIKLATKIPVSAQYHGFIIRVSCRAEDLGAVADALRELGVKAPRIDINENQVSFNAIEEIR